MNSAIQRLNFWGQAILNFQARWLENPLRIVYVNYGRGSNHFPSHVKWLHCRGGSGVEVREALAATLFLGQTEVRKAKKYHFQSRSASPFHLSVWMRGPSLLRLESAIAYWMDTFWSYLKITYSKYPRSLLNWFWTKLNNFEMRIERGYNVMMVLKEANTWYLSLLNKKEQPWSNLLTAENKYMIRNL